MTACSASNPFPNFLRLAGALLLCAFLSACASSGAGGRPRLNETALDPKAGKGIVVLNSTMQGVLYLESFNFDIRQAGNDSLLASNTIRHWGLFHPDYWGKFYQDIEKGGLGYVELPAGDYVLQNFGVSAGMWGGSRLITPRQPMAVPFKLAAGEVLHLGRLRVKATGDRNYVINPYAPNAPTPDGKSLWFDIKVADGLAEDMPKLREILPNVPTERFQSRPVRLPPK